MLAFTFHLLLSRTQASTAIMPPPLCVRVRALASPTCHAHSSSMPQARHAGSTSAAGTVPAGTAALMQAF